MKLETIAHNLLLNMDPERAHTLGKWAMKKKYFAPGRFYTPGSEWELFGCKLDNPLGLAAGFDKNGELADQISDYGFAYEEVGSITFQGGAGNSKPRLFRLDGGSLLNRMGLNGDPAEMVVQRLTTAQHYFAINIAKTHHPEIMGDKAIEDIVGSYKLVVERLEPLGNLIYVAFNVSCPNTREGKTFEDPASLQELLTALEHSRGARPWLIKLSPNLTLKQLYELLKVADDHVEGYICGNSLPMEHPVYGRGGASGALVKEWASQLIHNVRNLTRKPIIACGGIFTGQDAYRAVQQGATAGFQAYTGLVYGSPYRGPQFAHQINKEFLQLKQKEE